MRIVAWDGEEPVRCFGQQTWRKYPDQASCRSCGKWSQLRPDHRRVAIEGGKYNLGWRNDFQPKRKLRLPERGEQ